MEMEGGRVLWPSTNGGKIPTIQCETTEQALIFQQYQIRMKTCRFWKYVFMFTGSRSARKFKFKWRIQLHRWLTWHSLQNKSQNSYFILSACKNYFPLKNCAHTDGFGTFQTSRVQSLECTGRSVVEISMDTTLWKKIIFFNQMVIS